MSDQPKHRRVIELELGDDDCAADVAFLDRQIDKLAIVFALRKKSKNATQAKLNAGVMYRLLIDVAISNIAGIGGMDIDETNAMGNEIIEVLNRHMQTKFDSLRKGDSGE
jgi:phosphatidylserine/phosphatidylglycerophosphate/cardiolipin synthase-like enzyme